MNFLNKYPNVLAGSSMCAGIGLLMLSVSNWYLFVAGGIFVFLGYFIFHHLPEVTSAINDIADEVKQARGLDVVDPNPLGTVTIVNFPTANNAVQK